MNGTELARINGNYSTAFIGTYQVLGQNTEGNYTIFRLYAYFYYGGGTRVTSSYSTFQIDGTTVYNGSYSFTPGYHLLGTKDITVYHNNDGSYPGKYIGIYANSYHMSGSAGGNIYAGNITRQAYVTNATNFNDESNPTITFTNPAGFRINARLEFAGINIQRNNIPNTGSYTFSLTEEERELLRSKCPNSNTLAVREVIATCLNGTTESFWSWQDKTMNIVNANPTFNNFEFEDINEKTIELTGNNQNIIQGYSNVKVTVPVNYIATANKYATISKYSFTCSDVQKDFSYSDSESISNIIENVKAGVFNVYAIDSRNNSTLVVKNANQTIPYTSLSKENINVKRNNGVSEQTVLSFTGKIDLVNFGAVTNSIKSSKFRYKITDSSTWSEYKDIAITVDEKGNYLFNDYIPGDTDNGFDIGHAYNIEVIISDELSNVTFTANLGSGIPNIALHKNGVGIMGKYDVSEGGLLQLAGKNISKIIGEVILEYTFEDSNTNSISFDVDIKPGEWLNVVINGSATVSTDLFLTINDITSSLYYQTSIGAQNTNTGGKDANLTSYAVYRPQKTSFYYGHGLTNGWTTLFDKIGFILNKTDYYPSASWHMMAPWDSAYLYYSDGLLYSRSTQITKITYSLPSGYFASGTTIKIIKTNNGC